METKTVGILRIIKFIIWFVFIGLCIQTGAILFSFIFSLFINPEEVNELYLSLDASELINYSKGHYIVLISLLIIFTALKAYLFYWLIKITTKINLVHPFSNDIAKMVLQISYVALEIGLLAMVIKAYFKWIVKNGITISNFNDFVGGSGEFLFLAGIVFVIAQIFKRGIEIQAENELTI